MDEVLGVFQWIGNLVWWILGKLYGLLVWAYLSLVPLVGEGGTLVVMFMVMFFPVIIIFVRFINTSQGGIEDFSKSFMGVALQIFGVFLVMFLMLFVLSGA